MTGIEAAIIGTVLSTVGGLQQASAIRAAGKAQQQQAEYQAKQAQVAAGQELATGQRQQAEEARKLRYAQSRATAVAAATGGTMDDSFLNIMSGLESEGQYAKDFALFESKDRAGKLTQQSDLLKYEGQNARIAANAEAKAKTISTLANAASSTSTLYGKYGGNSGGSIYWNDGTTTKTRNRV
jgi:hypothetical protein